MISSQELTQAFSKLSQQAQSARAEVELTIKEGDSFSAVYQDRKLKKYSSDQTQNAVIRVLKGSGVGIASTENLAPESLENCFQEALRSAQDLDLGLDGGKIAEELVAPAANLPQVDVFTSDFEEIPIAQRLKWAEFIEREALDRDPRVSNVPYSGVQLASGKTWILNSKGMNQSFKSSSISGYAYALAKEGEKAKSGSASFFRRRAEGLPLAQVAHEGADRALRLLTAVQPPTGQYAVVLSNEVAAQLMGILDQHVSAKALDEGTSLFKDRIGEKIFSEKFNIVDNPLDPDLPGSRPFDVEGTASQKTPLFTNGVLRNFLTNSYFARKLNLPLTGNAVRTNSDLGISTSNMVVTPGNYKFEDLVNMAPEVIVITSAMGFHSGVKEMTGDFSLPSYGMLYRNGKPVEAVEQFVMSGNFFEIMKSVTAMSDRVNLNGSSVVCPDLFVPAMSIAGK